MLVCTFTFSVTCCYNTKANEEYTSPFFMVAISWLPHLWLHPRFEDCTLYYTCAVLQEIFIIIRYIYLHIPFIHILASSNKDGDDDDDDCEDDDSVMVISFAVTIAVLVIIIIIITALMMWYLYKHKRGIVVVFNMHSLHCILNCIYHNYTVLL